MPSAAVRGIEGRGREIRIESGNRESNGSCQEVKLGINDREDKQERSAR